MKLDEIKIAWNDGADKYNQWDQLSIDEMIEFTIEYVKSKCSKVCEKIVKKEEMSGKCWTERCIESIRAI